MTIFDSIKYQISIPPTEKELEALPLELFRKWAYQVEFGQLADSSWVSCWYERYVAGTDMEEIQLLRKMIAEWGE